VEFAKDRANLGAPLKRGGGTTLRTIPRDLDGAVVCVVAIVIAAVAFAQNGKPATKKGQTLQCG
jgi:hypothetical protein